MMGQQIFNVRDVIRDLVSESPSPDPEAIARAAAQQVPTEFLVEVLGQVLRGTVREVLAEHRPHGPIGRIPQPTFQAPASADVLPLPTRAAVTARAGARVTTVGSRKGAEIRDAWQRVLSSYYTTEGGRKQFGDLTYQDCQWVAAQMDTQSENLKARARGLRGLGSLLLEHEVETIRELPAEVKMQALGAA